MRALIDDQKDILLQFMKQTNCKLDMMIKRQEDFYKNVPSRVSTQFM